MEAWWHQPATALSRSPVYQIFEIPRVKQSSRYQVCTLTEVGSICVARIFQTVNSARQFCEKDRRDWLRKQPS